MQVIPSVRTTCLAKCDSKAGISKAACVLTSVESLDMLQMKEQKKKEEQVEKERKKREREEKKIQ